MHLTIVLLSMGKWRMLGPAQRHELTFKLGKKTGHSPRAMDGKKGDDLFEKHGSVRGSNRDAWSRHEIWDFNPKTGNKADAVSGRAVGFFQPY